MELLEDNSVLTLAQILHGFVGVVATVVDAIAEEIGMDAELAGGAGEVLAGVLCREMEMGMGMVMVTTMEDSSSVSTYWDPSPT